MICSGTGAYANISVKATANGTYEKFIYQSGLAIVHTTQTVTGASSSNPVTLVSISIGGRANSLLVMKIS